MMKTRRRALLSLLILVMAIHAPWKLAVLVGHALFVMEPSYTRTVSGNGQYWEARDLMYRAEQLGYPVEFVDGLAERDEAYGMTIPEHDEAHAKIVIESSLSWDARYSVLAHEVGHVLQPVGMTRNQRDVFAESVSYLVAGGLREHARYLASMRGDVFTALWYWPQIYRAAEVERSL